MVTVTETKLMLPTYPEPAAEELPMFAENRVHQRTSGNPYPNHVVLRVDRSHKENREYICIRLENDYLRLEILPELGGKIYSAYDKITGYDFFYKQHVIKPALIGCLGSWISGGCEFNWPFHHRASTFMPADYTIEHEADGGVIVWLSEHDPIDRMKGMVGVVLKPDCAYFETRMRLCNRTPVKRSFLWWENTAVPVHQDYQIFYPKDVSYVNFHYKRSVTTYPIATNALGVFNGIRYDGETDISMHKNTKQPTSYFCGPSKYDFFGGYDHRKDCGVVHVADHHISTGKKMFTWAYNQLSESWENALTDTDGAYAELMAGSYSDNQPDFSWIEPYETKSFSQYWYPIGAVGIPCFANLDGAISWNEKNLTLQLTKSQTVRILTFDGENQLPEQELFMTAGIPQKISAGMKKIGARVEVFSGESKILSYTEEKKNQYDIPDTTEDMPNFKTVKTAQELYLEGVHVWQYRDPAVPPVKYWEEALLRDPEHIPSMLALGMWEYTRCNLEKALDLTNQAIAVLTRYNKQPESGKASYQLGLILDALGESEKAYDAYYKASWNQDVYAASMTRLSAIDAKRQDFVQMEEHAKNALRYQTQNPVAGTLLSIALERQGRKDEAKNAVSDLLKTDPLNHFARFWACCMGIITRDEFYTGLKSDPSQTGLDIAIHFYDCGMTQEAETLLEGIPDKSPMVYYFLGNDKKAETTPLTSSFAFRIEEYRLLKTIDLPMAHYYLGCLLYAGGRYQEAEQEFLKTVQRKPEFYIPYRNLAALYYSHLNRKDQVLPLLQKALERHPEDEQLIFETVYVMGRLGVEPGERIAFLQSHPSGRDDVLIELARAYNQNGDYEKTIALFDSHTFVPCEGGEHAVAEQYMFAYYGMGRKAYDQQDYEQAEQCFEKAQILPKNLGAGLWNECRLVPHQFYAALCAEKLGNKEKAHTIYQHILCLEIDYFSNMHLPELPYYQAACYDKTGDFLSARALIDRYQKKWKKAILDEDAGYFGTTPFFLSYCDSAKDMRKAYYSALLGYCYRFMGETELSKKAFDTAHSLDCGNLFYTLETQLS